MKTQKRCQQCWLLSIPDLSNTPEFHLSNGVLVYSSDQVILMGDSWPSLLLAELHTHP